MQRNKTSDNSVEEAIKAYKQALTVQSDDIDTIIKLANAFHDLRRWPESIPLYEQALVIQPDNAVVHKNLGDSLQKFGQPQMALKCFEQALHLRPDYADASNKLALALLEAGKAEQAIVHLEQTIHRDPDDTVAHVNLAAALMYLGRAEHSVQRLEHHLGTRPECCALYHYIAMIKPKQDQIPVIEKLLGQSTLSDSDAMYCHFALGNIFEDGKSYDQAFNHFLKANALYRQTFDYDFQNNTLLVDRLTKVYSRRFFHRKGRLGSNSELPVFILGMPRSGSTLVEQVISSHAQVYGAGELQAIPAVTHSITQQLKYANPYPECMSLIDKELVEGCSARYLHEIALHCPTAARIVDKLPGNFFRIGLIKTLFPRARIIDCQRNPRDNCISLFFHYFPNQEHTFDLSELGRYYVDYRRLMSYWHSLFPGEIFTVQYEDLVTDPEVVSKQLIDYLGLEWDERCLNFHDNERVVMTSSSFQVRQPMYRSSIDRWKHFGTHLQPLVEVLHQAH